MEIHIKKSNQKHRKIKNPIPISLNRNPGYPSTFTATSAGTCTYRIEKASDDICQLRLDFETFSGFTTTATPQPGACQVNLRQHNF